MSKSVLDSLVEFDLAFGAPTLVGVDEAGRGPLAGPVVAAAVVMNYKKLSNPLWDKLNDSKKLSAKRREELSRLIRMKATAFALGVGSVEEIDQHNILQAAHMAMRRAIDGLELEPDKVIVDGVGFTYPGYAPLNIVEGDGKSAAIAAAGILAKVHRDELMVEFDKEFPQYGFAAHKGYGTKAHREALEKYGPCRLHRMSFAPVQIAAAMHSPTTNE